MHNNCKYESEKIVKKIHNLIYMLRTLTLSTIPKYLKTFSGFATYVHNYISTLVEVSDRNSSHANQNYSDICIRANANNSEPIRKKCCISFDVKR